jgi:hypothetical protein
MIAYDFWGYGAATGPQARVFRGTKSDPGHPAGPCPLGVRLTEQLVHDGDVVSSATPAKMGLEGGSGARRTTAEGAHPTGLGRRTRPARRKAGGLGPSIVALDLPNVADPMYSRATDEARE